MDCKECTRENYLFYETVGAKMGGITVSEFQRSKKKRVAK